MIPSTPQKPTSQANLQQLLQVDFIQQALYQLLEPERPSAQLLVVNHQDRYLSLSNEKDYIALLTENTPALLAQVQEADQGAGGAEWGAAKESFPVASGACFLISEGTGRYLWWSGFLNVEREPEF